MKKFNKKIKRTKRNRKKLKSVNDSKFRITVYKSLKNISAQIINDNLRKTVVSASSTEKELKKTKLKKIEVSNILGENGKLPLTLSVWFPIFVLIILSIIGLIKINEK